MDTKKTIAKRITELRKERGFTQQQVADITNTSRSAYSQYETADRQPSIDTLIKLADLYKCSVDYLIGRY